MEHHVRNPNTREQPVNKKFTMLGGSEHGENSGGWISNIITSGYWVCLKRN